MEKFVLMQLIVELDKDIKLIEETRSSLFVLHLEENRLNFLLEMANVTNKIDEPVSQGPILIRFHL